MWDEADYLTREDFASVRNFCQHQRITLMPGEPSEELVHGDHHLKGFVNYGPCGGGCDIVNRVAWVQHLRPHELLHEALHIFLAMPFIPTDHQPDEYMMLMPVERAYGEALLNPHWLQECVEWQEMTTVQPPGHDQEELQYIPNYHESTTWLRGLSIGVSLGVLTSDFAPTFQAPDWNNLSLEDRGYLCEGYRAHVSLHHHM